MPVICVRSFRMTPQAPEGPAPSTRRFSRKLVATGRTGSRSLLPSPFPGGQAAVIDLTKPAAQSEWWRNRIARNLLDLERHQRFSNDFREQVRNGMKVSDGTSAALMHNRYRPLQTKVTSAVDAWAPASGRRNGIFFFQRAGFTGSLSIR